MSKRSMKEDAYTKLRRKLIYCEYPPGSILNETQIATELGLSRTPVREAIGLLERDGFIKILPKKGLFVTNVTLQDVLQIYQTRIEIEPLALRLSCNNIPIETLVELKKRIATSKPYDSMEAFREDFDIHYQLMKYCGNHYIIELITNMIVRTHRSVIASGQLSNAKVRLVPGEHMEIVEALINQEYEEAITKLRNHLIANRKETVGFIVNAGYDDSLSQLITPVSM